MGHGTCPETEGRGVDGRLSDALIFAVGLGYPLVTGVLLAFV
ncbi:hypothetical protein [Streptomyces albogriseolus]